MANIHHAEMAHLIRRENELEERIDELRKDFGTWKDRVELARNTGRDELALRAEERLDKLRQEARELGRELKLIVAKKRLIRRESRRPSGNEVRRAEALLESFRQSGLVDPDEAEMEAEFDALRHQDPGSQDAAASPEQESDVAINVDEGAQSSVTETSPRSVDTNKPSQLDSLDLEDLENLDIEDLERLIAAEES